MFSRPSRTATRTYPYQKLAGGNMLKKIIKAIEEWSWNVKYGRHFGDQDYR